MRAFSLVLAGSLLLASQALAGSLDAKEREAKKACLNGDPVKGVSILTDLYVDTNDPTFIYNQGRCYEQNNRYEDAISRFREYLRKVGPKHKGDRASAEKHIADCQKLMAEQRSEEARSTPVPVPPAAVPPPAAPVPPAPPAPEVQTPPPPTVKSPSAAAPLPPPVAPPPAPPDSQAEPAPALSSTALAPTPVATPGAALRTTGLVVAAVGGAAIVAGVVFNLEHNSKVSDLAPDYTRDKESSSKTYKTVSMLGYGVGAACLVGGAVIYYLGWRAGSETQVALVPSVMDGGAGALLAGAF